MTDSAKMKPVFVGIQVSVVVGILITMTYLGKPVYWELMSRSGIYSENPLYGQGGNFSSGIPDRLSSSQKPSIKSVWKNPIWKEPVPGSKMPSYKAFVLSKEMVSHRAKDNIIIVSFGNYAFMDFVLNWVKHLTDLGLQNILVGAMDNEILKSLYWKGVPVYDMGSKMITTDPGWGSPMFHKMGREKVSLINAFLSFGYELLICDTDMVWLKDPLPYFARFPAADILTSSDQVVPTVTDDSLEAWSKVNAAFNIGIFHWRPTNVSRKFARQWYEMLVGDDKIWDQNGFNELILQHYGPSVDAESGLVYAYDGKLKLGVLPASIFCSGHTYFVQAQYEQFGLEPYAVHTTFQYAGTDGKRHRLREAKLFYDNPEYYDSEGGFLSFNPAIPEELLTVGNHTIESHFASINYQMKQIRNALAIAYTLNRTLVMPPLWCRFDRIWYGHPGILRGTKTRQPFLCPLDHVFEINIMLQSFPEEDFGPVIPFREYSFLENPRLPSQVKESKLSIQLCDQDNSNCDPEKDALEKETLKLSKNMSDEQLRDILSIHKDKKLLHFSTMQDAFGGFLDKVKDKKFRRRVKRYVGIWCCVEGLERGHIWYDMYWDEKPDWKPRPPATVEDDHPNW